MTENYLNAFKPSAYARVFGRALVNQCQQTQYNDPMYVCSADENSGDGHLVLSVNIDNKESTEIIKERNLREKSGNIEKSIDSFVYIPFYEIDTGNIG